MPMISVIVPIYNVELYLHRCVDSVLNQTITDFELILVDDGSPDNCGAICDEYAKKDSRITVIHKDNGGLSDARNVGIDWAFMNSDSDWITFIDSDDWVHPRYLEQLYQACTEHDVMISVCNYVRSSGELSERYWNSIIPIICEPESFWCENSILATIACGKLYQKDLFEDIRFPVGKYHEDEYTTYRVLYKCRSVAYLDYPLYYYFYNPKSITNQQWTPYRMDSIDAMLECVTFFQNSEFKKSYDYSVKKALGHIVWQIRNLNDSGDSVLKKKYLPRLRRYLQKALSIARKTEGFHFKNYLNYYTVAYPCLNNFLSVALFIKHKLCKKNK